MQEKIVSRTLAGILSITGILLLVSLLSASGAGVSPASGTGVVTVPGEFLFSSFSFAAFLVPLYFFLYAATLLAGRYRPNVLLDINFSLFPFFTLALIFRLMFTPEGSGAAAFMMMSFGRLGGVIVLTLLLALEVLLYIQYRPRLRVQSDERTQRKEPDREKAFRAGTAERSGRSDGHAVLQLTSRVSSSDHRKQTGPVNPVTGAVRPEAAGTASLPEETDTRVPQPDEQFSFRIPTVPDLPELRSLKSLEDREEKAVRKKERKPVSRSDDAENPELPAPEPSDDVVSLEISAEPDDSVDENAPGRNSSSRENQDYGTDFPEAQLYDYEEEAEDLPEPEEQQVQGSEIPEREYPLKRSASAEHGLRADRHSIDDADNQEDEPEGVREYEYEASEPEEWEELPEEDSDDFDDPESADDEPERMVARKLPEEYEASEYEAAEYEELEDYDEGSGEEADEDEEDYTDEDEDEESAPGMDRESGTSSGKASSPAVIEVPQKRPIKPGKPYSVPIQGILKEYEDGEYWVIDEATKKAAWILKETLEEFKIQAEVTGIRKGPVITMFEILPAPGVKLSKIVNLADNIALRLAASSVRIVAPIPGKHAVGIEVPNKKRAIVSFSEMLSDESFSSTKTEIPIALGKDIAGGVQIMDLTQTPHLLIAGATGSGKSVCVNSLICSVLYRRSPEEVRLLLIDPKIVELKFYNDIPHLLTPVITDPKRAFQALQYCIYEMERRYTLLDAFGVRDIKSYNRKIRDRNLATQKLPYIVVIVDEFADLMATTGKELESTLARLAAMSRAVGIHLVLATQRPSIDVITGLIKANIPSRIAFMVASKFDSRIIIDSVGAEKLLGKGDMLFASAWDPFPVRMQGAFLSEDEVERIVEHVKTLGEPDYIDDEIFIDDDEDEDVFSEGEDDPLLDKAIDIVVTAGKASASYLQRRLKIGYNRAARLVENLEHRGIVGPQNGSKPRDILHIPDDYQK